MVKVIGYSVYYYNIVIDVKKQILWQLTNGQKQVFTVINMLGLSINTLIIQVVIYIGIPKKMCDYI